MLNTVKMAKKYAKFYKKNITNNGLKRVNYDDKEMAYSKKILKKNQIISTE